MGLFGICDSCERLLQAAILIPPGKTLIIPDDARVVMTCECGGKARIPSGIYQGLAQSVYAIATTASSQRMREVLRALKQVREESVTLEHLTKVAPELNSLKSWLPQKRSELYPFIIMIITALGLLLDQCDSDERKDVTDDEVGAAIACAIRDAGAPDISGSDTTDLAKE